MSKSNRRLMAMPDVLTALCPGCHTEPALLVGLSQWFCETEDCRVLMWNPTMDAADCLATAKLLRIVEDL